ncbi:MAG TPA: ABC transporter ATP-binding protein, partial [Dehalococcoidia bacterium]|nr:ABC transporter ATP-binding protein [Dehalococcoidia bacterium]
VAVIGATGCGKSTLLRIAGGLLTPSSGTVLIDERPPQDAQRHKRIGFVFQDPALLPWRSVRSNVRLPLEVNRRQASTPADVDTLLATVGLAGAADRRPHELSGGMRRRVALARALALDPALLLMDEPFAALDELTRESMRYELLRIWERHRATVLFVTHSVREAVLLADRVVVMTPGPGRIRAIVPVDLPRPRRTTLERDPAFLDRVDRLRDLLS